MKVYARSYLDEVVETQGRLFDYVVDHYSGSDTFDFIETYMKSYTRAAIDAGQAYVCTMDAETLFDYFVEYEGYTLKDGITYGGFAPNWVGQFYALFQWVYKIPSKEVVELLPVEFMFSVYPGFHDYDLQVAVDKIGERVNLRKDGNSTEKGVMKFDMFS